MFPHVGGKMKIQLNRELLEKTFTSLPHILDTGGRFFLTLCKGNSAAKNHHHFFSVSDQYLFIWYGSGISGWIPIRILSGSRVWWPKIEKNTDKKILLFFLDKKRQFTYTEPQNKPSALKSTSIFLALCGSFLPF
jgi:hypothetical protein